MTIQQLQEERVADLAELEHSVGIIDEDGYPTQALLDYISQAITQTAEAATKAERERCIKIVGEFGGIEGFLQFHQVREAMVEALKDTNE